MAPTTMYLIYIGILLGLPVAAIWRSLRRFARLDEEMRDALAVFDGTLNRRLALFPRMRAVTGPDETGDSFVATTEMNSLAARMNGVEERQRLEALLEKTESRFLALTNRDETLSEEIRSLSEETDAAREGYNRLVSKNRKLHGTFFSGLAAAILSWRKAEYLAGPLALETKSKTSPEY